MFCRVLDLFPKCRKQVIVSSATKQQSSPSPNRDFQEPFDKRATIKKWPGCLGKFNRLADAPLQAVATDRGLG